mmetsp:Transcript_109824/g.317531  ORF Transcript_109824/g.317531 Transcript_109824/m.317531 type:complete len:234 (-) Transcript_109824:1062-1763(-)
MKRVISCNLKCFRKTSEDTSFRKAFPRESNLRRLSVHGVPKNPKLPSEVLHHTLQSQTNTESRDLILRQQLNRLRKFKVSWVARSRGENHHVRFVSSLHHFLNRCQGRWAAAKRSDGGARLSKIVSKCVNKGVFVVDKDNTLSVSNLFGKLDSFCADAYAIFTALSGYSIHHSRSFQFGFKLFCWRVGIIQQGSSCSNFSNAILDSHSSKGQTSVQAAIKTNHTNSTSVPASW